MLRAGACGVAASGTAVEIPESERGQGDFRGILYVFFMILFGSMTAGAAKIAVRDLPVALVPVLRFGLAAVCMLPLLGGRGRSVVNVVRRDPLLLLLAAAFCVPINQLFFLSAARLGPTSHVAIFYATCPLIVLLTAWVMRLEPPDLRRLWGVMLSVAGIVLIAIGNFWEAKGPVADASQVALGDLMLIGAVLSWSGYLVVSKPLVARHGAMPVLIGTLALGTVLALPAALVMWPGWSNMGAVSTSSWVALLALALLITPLGWAFQNLSMGRFDASQVATFSNSAPVLTIVWGMWLFDERLTPSLVAGSVLTMAGVYWASRPRRVAQTEVSTPREPRLREAVAASPLGGGGGGRTAPVLLLSEEPGL